MYIWIHYSRLNVNVVVVIIIASEAFFRPFFKIAAESTFSDPIKLRVRSGNKEPRVVRPREFRWMIFRLLISKLTSKPSRHRSKYC